MEKILFSPGEFSKLKKVLILYESALKILNTKMDIIISDYNTFEAENPIGQVKSRLKTPESIAAKLHKRGFPVTAESAKVNLSDIVGMRVICSFSKDIPTIARKIREQNDLIFINEDDYITFPKPSGYRSYHMTMGVPVYIGGRCEIVNAEIQIRTAAMDFWATMEHKVRYKYHGKIPEYISEELYKCAEKTNEIDETMYQIHDIIAYINT